MALLTITCSESPESLETRQNDIAGKLAGLAAPFESYIRIARNSKEKIRSGAFTRSLDEVNSGERNIKLLVDHNDQKLLADTKTATLTLRETKEGLEFNATLPDTTLGRDIKSLSDSKLLSGVSIGFKNRGDTSRIGQQMDTGKESFELMRPSPIAGKLDGSSWIEGRNKDDGSQWRVLTEIDVREVSVLTGAEPAFPETTVQSRNKTNLLNWLTIYANF